METFSAGFVRAMGENIHLIALRGSQKNLLWWLPYAFVKALWMARQVDIIHLGDGVLSGLGAWLHWLTGKPVSVTLHGLDLTYPKFGYPSYIHWALPKLQGFTVVSDATAAVVKKDFQLSATVICNGITVEEWPLNDELGKNKCILFVGRLVERKGCAWFIEHVLPQLPGVHLHIVGDGKELGRCQEIVERLQLSEQVRFHGQVSAQVLAKHYTQAQALIMPNIVIPGDMEGFGLVALEAAACGLPVVAADLEGIRSVVIDGSTGILVKSGQVSAWTEAIQQVLTAPFQPEKIRQQVANRFSWRTIGEQYRQVFQKITKP